MRNGLLSRVDAEHPGVYHIYDACLQAGPRPALHFFTDDGRVPDPIAQDRATAVWCQCVGRRPEEWPALGEEATRIREQVQEPVYFFHRLHNPAHSLHDSLFSVALLALGEEGYIPYFSHFVDSSTGPPVSADAHGGLFVHRACGIVDAEGELLPQKNGAARLVCFRHLVVPKFMRHRFAHEWGSTSSWWPMHYIDQASDYPQRVLEKLRARLFASCFGEKVVPWDSGHRHGPYNRLLLDDRGGTSRRRWSNGAEAFRWLEKKYRACFSSMQYVSADYARLSPQEQARLFHDADVVIAPHGGALANLIFCRPGTRIIELTDEVGSVGWSTFTRRLGMKHFPVRPDSMTDHYPETFDVPIEMVDALVRAHLLGAE